MSSSGFTALSDEALEGILTKHARRESRAEPVEVEFKSDFDGSPAAWLDVLKHVMAMANSGGGSIVFGVAPDGDRSGMARTLLTTFDPANITNKLRRYTPARVTTAYRELVIDQQRLGFLLVEGSRAINVFESDGNFRNPS
jgi:predicted HTH transcriptional regulator